MYELYNQEKITEYVHYELMQKSREEGRVKGLAEGLLASIQCLMESMGWSVQQAMEEMKVPEPDYQKYLAAWQIKDGIKLQGSR